MPSVERRAERDDERAAALEEVAAGMGCLDQIRHLSPLRRRLRGALDCVDDSVVRAAAADVAVEGLLDLRLGRARVLLQERDRLHHHAVDAVAALGRLLVDERLDDRVRVLLRAEPLERRDLLPGHGRDGHDAGADRLPVHVHGAGPALREPAAEARAVQVELVAQDVEQRRVRRRLDGVALAVHRQLHCLGHSLPLDDDAGRASPARATAAAGRGGAARLRITPSSAAGRQVHGCGDRPHERRTPAHGDRRRAVRRRG